MMSIVKSKNENTKRGVSGRRGFTLLETMFAILVVSVGILGIHNGMNFAMKNTKLARENFVGTYLAQEGIEIVKNLRDYNWVNDNSDDAGPNRWTLGLESCTSGCQADYTSTQLDPFAGNLLKLKTNGFYGYSSDPADLETIYRRKITIIPVDIDSDGEDEELDITVDVFWGSATTTVKENIYNWYMPS